MIARSRYLGQLPPEAARLNGIQFVNNDIRLSVSFKGHRKRRKLEMLLGPSAVLCLIDLWISTAPNHPKGNLSGLDDIDIALEAGWQGNPCDFVNALISCGFLDGESGLYALHDWMDHQSYVVHAPERSAQARRAAEAKWSKMRGACSEHAGSTQGAMLNAKTSNAPSPDPIPSPDPLPDPSPIPSQQKKTSLPGKPDDGDKKLRQILEYLNLKTGKGFRAVDTNLRLIRARLREGITESELMAIVDRKCAEWIGTKREPYLRPSTLFGAEKCNQYVGELTRPSEAEESERKLKEWLGDDSAIEGEVL